MKRLLSIMLVMLLAMSFAMAARAHYVRLSPAGLVFPLVGGESEDIDYKAEASYTGYFWGGNTHTVRVMDTDDVEDDVAHYGGYTSPSGYRPRQYMRADEETTIIAQSERKNAVGIYEESIKTIGLKLAIEGAMVMDNLGAGFEGNPVKVTVHTP